MTVVTQKKLRIEPLVKEDVPQKFGVDIFNFYCWRAALSAKKNG